MAAHFSASDVDVAREVLGADALGGGANDDPVSFGLDVVDDLA